GWRTSTSRRISPPPQRCEEGLKAKSRTGRSSSTRRASSPNDRLARRFYGTSHTDFVHQPRPEERALELVEGCRVSKDGHRRDRACGHPSRQPRKERGLLRMRSEGVGGTRL